MDFRNNAYGIGQRRQPNDARWSFAQNQGGLGGGGGGGGSTNSSIGGIGGSGGLNERGTRTTNYGRSENFNNKSNDYGFAQSGSNNNKNAANINNSRFGNIDNNFVSPQGANYNRSGDAMSGYDHQRFPGAINRGMDSPNNNSNLNDYMREPRQSSQNYSGRSSELQRFNNNNSSSNYNRGSDNYRGADNYRGSNQQQPQQQQQQQPRNQQMLQHQQPQRNPQQQQQSMNSPNLGRSMGGDFGGLNDIFNNKSINNRNNNDRNDAFRRSDNNYIEIFRNLDSHTDRNALVMRSNNNNNAGNFSLNSDSGFDSDGYRGPNSNNYNSSNKSFNNNFGSNNYDQISDKPYFSNGNNSNDFNNTQNNNMQQMVARQDGGGGGGGGFNGAMSGRGWHNDMAAFGDNMLQSQPVWQMGNNNPNNNYGMNKRNGPGPAGPGNRNMNERPQQQQQPPQRSYSSLSGRSNPNTAGNKVQQQQQSWRPQPHGGNRGQQQGNNNNNKNNQQQNNNNNSRSNNATGGRINPQSTGNRNNNSNTNNNANKKPQPQQQQQQQRQQQQQQKKPNTAQNKAAPAPVKAAPPQNTQAKPKSNVVQTKPKPTEAPKAPEPKVGQKRPAAPVPPVTVPVAKADIKRRKLAMKRGFLLGGFKLPYVNDNQQTLPQPEAKSYALMFFEQLLNYSTSGEELDDLPYVPPQEIDGRDAKNAAHTLLKRMRKRFHTEWTGLEESKKYKSWSAWWSDYKWCEAVIKEQLQRFGSINVRDCFLPDLPRLSTEEVVHIIIKQAEFGLTMNSDNYYNNMKSMLTLMNNTFLENLQGPNIGKVQDIIRAVPNQFWVYKMRSMVYLWSQYRDISKNSSPETERGAKELKAISKDWNNPLFHWIAKQAFEELRAISEVEWPEHNQLYKDVQSTEPINNKTKSTKTTTTDSTTTAATTTTTTTTTDATEATETAETS